MPSPEELPTTATTPLIDTPAQQGFLQGPRQIGEIPGPNGSSIVRSVDADGALIVRQVGSPYKSASDFYGRQVAAADHFEDTVGVRPAGAPPRVEVSPTGPAEVVKSGRMASVRAMGRKALSALGISRSNKKAT